MNELAKLKMIIADVLNVDPDELTPETTFADDLGADSLDLYQIILNIEDEFGITVPQEEVAQITSVGQALEMLQGALGA